MWNGKNFISQKADFHFTDEEIKLEKLILFPEEFNWMINSNESVLY